MKLKLESLHFQKITPPNKNVSVIMVNISDIDGIPTTTELGTLYENQNYQFSMLINKSESEVRKMSVDEIEKLAFEQLKNNITDL